jgi:hypothetical protein
MTNLSRRQLLVGGAAFAVLTACSGDDSADPDPTTTAPTASGGDGASTLLVLLPQQGVLTTAGPQRVPLAVAGADGVPVREGLAPRTFQVRTDSGSPVEIEVEPHSDGVPTPYYPVVFTPETTGIHEITVLGEDQFNAVTFDIGETSAIPSIGQDLPPVATPTTDAARGVDPICTRDPACELHAVSLADALGAGPIALSISTPEFCQTAICGPVLDLLIEALPGHPTVTGIHAEVYADPRGGTDPTAGGLSPIAEDYALPFEPVLYLVDASGRITNRLDSVYDRVELNAALAEIA